MLSLVGLPQEEQIAALRARQDADAHTPLELSEAGVRVSLRRLSKDELVILLLAHHGLADGWSVEVIAEELLQTLNGEPSLSPATA